MSQIQGVNTIIDYVLQKYILYHLLSTIQMCSKLIFYVKNMHGGTRISRREKYIIDIYTSFNNKTYHVFLFIDRVLKLLLKKNHVESGKIITEDPIDQ